MPSPKKRSLTAKKGGPVSQPGPRPQCRLHSIPMKFDVTRMAWVCTNHVCFMVAYPKNDFSQPTVGKGELELVTYTDEDGYASYFIRAMDNNVMLNVTNVISNIVYGGRGGLLNYATVTFDHTATLDTSKQKANP